MSVLHGAAGIDENSSAAILRIVATSIMAFATWVWLARAGRRYPREPEREAESRDAELLMACVLLNVSAAMLWNALAGVAAMVRLWALHALAAGAINLIVHSARALRQHGNLRPVGWAAGYALMATLIALGSAPAHAQNTAAEVDAFLTTAGDGRVFGAGVERHFKQGRNGR